MNKTSALLLIVIAALSFVLIITTQGRATAKSFMGVIPFATSGDRFGFFDQTSGRIYLYDSNISQCVFKGQVADLGQPIQALDIKDAASSNPAA